MTIRADLTGSTIASAAGITVTGHAPVTRLCRALIRAGHDPATRLDAYRDETLCLQVRSIGEGGALTVNENTKDGKPRFARYTIPNAVVRAGPEIAQSDQGAIPLAPDLETLASDAETTP